MSANNFSREDWENIDAAALFPNRLHANKLTKIDPVAFKKGEEDDGEWGNAPAEGGEPSPPQDGDMIKTSPPPEEQHHADQIYEMEGAGDSSADNREVQADKEEDRRTQSEPEEAEDMDAEEQGSDSSDAGADASQEGDMGDAAPVSGQPAEPDQTGEGGAALDKAPPSPEAKDGDTEKGAEQPVQKESEWVEELAEATSKTSEDVHGGDEATKDIEDSPNAANDGQNPDNHGAESGQGGDTGNGAAEGSENQEAGAEGGKEAADAESGKEAVDPFGAEAWEAQSARSVTYRLLSEVASKRPDTASGGGAAVDYSQQKGENASLRKIFHGVRELIRKLVSEEDFTARQDGTARWDAKTIARRVVRYQHTRIPGAKYRRPRENKIVFFVDISGSVSALAEMFMALMGGAAGLRGVHIVVGSEAHAEYEIAVPKPFKRVEDAIEFFRGALNHQNTHHPMGACSSPTDNTAWRRPYEHPFEPGVKQFLQDKGLWGTTTTCVFFGDMQGVHFDVKQLKEIVRTVRCLWLFTDEPGHYTHTDDLPRAVEAKLSIVYNVRSVNAFAWAVRRLAGSICSGYSLVAPPTS